MMEYQDFEVGKKLVDNNHITFNAALTAAFLLARNDADLESLQRAFPAEFADLMTEMILPRKSSRNYMQQLEDWAALNGE